MTPYISSIIIDYGIQQKGAIYAVPLEMNAASYRASLNLVDNKDKNFVEQCFEEIDLDHPAYIGDGETYYYVLSTFGLFNISRLEKIFMPVLAYTYDNQEWLNDIEKLGSPDVENVDPALIDKHKSAIENINQSDSINEMYYKAIGVRLAVYKFFGIDHTWFQINFIIVISVIMIITVLLYLFATIIGTYLASKISYKISQSLRKQQFAKVMNFSSHDMDKFSRASLITRATNDLQVVQNTSVFVIRAILIAPVMLIIGLLMSVVTAPSLIWIVGLAVFLILILAILLLALVTPQFKIIQKLIDKINETARESISGVPIIRALNNEKYQENRFDKVNKKLYKKMLYANSLMVLAMPLLMLTINILTISILWCGSFQIQIGEVNVGQLIAFITYATETIFAFLSIAAGFIMLPRANVSLGRIEEVLKHKLIIDNYNIKTKKKSTEEKTNEEEFIKIKDVNFSYKENETENKIFNTLNLNIKKNSINAIVGPTGSGKTTLLKLLLRFYDPNCGSISIDDINIKDYNEKDLRDLISYVPQKVILFQGTLRGNVSMNPKVKDNKWIEECIRFSNLGPFMDSNKEGMEYRVSENASNLSGGQKQRLTISRAISEKCPILLLDDPFSALDATTENIINTQLLNDFDGVTILLVTQRLSSVVKYDNIIYLDHGKVKAQGTHDELINNCDDYRQAYEKAKSPSIEDI